MGPANNLGHSFTYMGIDSIQLKTPNKSLFVENPGLVTGELYLLALKISFYLYFPFIYQV